MCPGVCLFCMSPTPSPIIREKGQSLHTPTIPPPYPHHQPPPYPHAPMADPAVFPLPSCNQLMATNLWGLENAVKAVISGEGP